MKQVKLFNTNKRVKLGMWGLGRGFSFFDMCKQLNIDVVAGCDYNEHMRENFLRHNPGAFATADADEFLQQDFDAVLLATYCPNHAPDAIRCLKAGKHVLSEVTSFRTMAEGVELVDAVEKYGKIYNLAENYPFSAANSWLTRKWKEGLFGELQYAEYEYVHECRGLQYTYIDGVPVQPGHALHNWRSWQAYHYYCTHSLGPVMIITGLRPVQVVALPTAHAIPGQVRPRVDGHDMAVAPSLIRMSNGGVVRNLMGTTTNDTHHQRLWGTLASAEVEGDSLSLRLGGSGGTLKQPVTPSWDSLGKLAASTGHGGGDFWVLYYFVRQILTGEPAPFDIYTAADVTIPGILSLRSAVEGGKAYDVPDFRDKAQREAWRNDTWAQEPIDTRTYAFGPGADTSRGAADFSRTMADLTRHAPDVRAWLDWQKVEIQSPEAIVPVGQTVVNNHPATVEIYRRARRIAEAYPGTEGARVLLEMLDLGCEKDVLDKGFLAKVKRTLAAIKRKHNLSGLRIEDVKATGLLPKPKKIAEAVKPGKTVRFSHDAEFATHGGGMWFVCHIHEKKKDGLIYLRGTIDMAKAGKGTLLYGVDGPAKLWLNGKEVDCRPAAKNPVIPDQYKLNVSWKKGANEVLFALDTKKGHSWGVCARGELN